MRKIVSTLFILFCMVSVSSQEIFSSPLSNKTMKIEISEYLNISNGVVTSRKTFIVETIEKHLDDSYHIYIKFDSTNSSILLTNVVNINVQVGLVYEPEAVIGKIDKDYLGIKLTEKDFQSLFTTEKATFSFAIPTGSPVYALSDGVVMDTNYDMEYGNYIDIDYTTASLKVRYSHLKSFNVMRNFVVHKNDILGTTGRSGNVNNSCIGIGFPDFQGSLIFVVTQ